MNDEEVLGAFSLVRNPIVLTEEEVKDVQKAIKKLQQENKYLREVIDKAIAFYESNKQECVIGRTRDERLIKRYYLPSQLSKALIDILKEVSE